MHSWYEAIVNVLKPSWHRTRMFRLLKLFFSFLDLVQLKHCNMWYMMQKVQLRSSLLWNSILKCKE